MASIEISSDAGALRLLGLQGMELPVFKKNVQHHGRNPATYLRRIPRMTYTMTPEWAALESEVRRTTTCTQYVHEQMYKARVDCDTVLAETSGDMAAVMRHIVETTAGYRREADWCDAVDGLGPQE
jgi:hypothetical protein